MSIQKQFEDCEIRSGQTVAFFSESDGSFEGLGRVLGFFYQDVYIYSTLDSKVYIRSLPCVQRRVLSRGEMYSVMTTKSPAMRRAS